MSEEQRFVSDHIKAVITDCLAGHLGEAWPQAPEGTRQAALDDLWASLELFVRA